jgi:hypothetical protein
MKLKDRLRELVQMCFRNKNGQRRYSYLVLGRDRSILYKNKILWSYQNFSETETDNNFIARDFVG